MIVCHCRCVSDRAIRAAVAGGAASVEQVAARCGAGTCCGGCEPAIEEIVEKELQAQATHRRLEVMPEATAGSQPSQSQPSA